MTRIILFKIANALVNMLTEQKCVVPGRVVGKEFKGRERQQGGSRVRENLKPPFAPGPSGQVSPPPAEPAHPPSLSLSLCCLTQVLHHLHQHFVSSPPPLL